MPRKVWLGPIKDHFLIVFLFDFCHSLADVQVSRVHSVRLPVTLGKPLELVDDIVPNVKVEK